MKWSRWRRRSWKWQEWRRRGPRLRATWFRTSPQPTGPLMLLVRVKLWVGLNLFTAFSSSQPKTELNRSLHLRPRCCRDDDDGGSISSHPCLTRHGRLLLQRPSALPASKSRPVLPHQAPPGRAPEVNLPLPIPSCRNMYAFSFMWQVALTD